MQIHNVGIGNVDRPYVVLCVDPVTSCAWTIVHNNHIWMACAPHGSENN